MRLLFFSFLILIHVGSIAQSYQGENMLNLLGQIKDSSDVYNAFAKEWGLGRKTSKPDIGFKISKNFDTQRVTAMFFAGKGFEVGELKFNKFEKEMPFGLTMDDDINILLNKLGAPKKGGDEYAKFAKNGVVIMAKFKNKARTKLEFIKISLAFGQLTYNPNYVEEEDVEDVEIITPVPQFVEKTIPAPKLTAKEKMGIVETLPATFSSSPNSSRMSTSGLANKSTFYRAVMKAMKSGSESYFETIKSGEVTTINNFWNYKYTYKSTLKIPNEQYNFIYSFPFATSQRDFVAVLKEGDYDDSFKEKYYTVLTQIKADFMTSEGWRYSNPKDEDASYPLKDVEVQNERFGSVILDYHKKPNGQSVLYLRFILYYD